MQIKYTPHREIDKSRWDDTVDRAFNGILYPYSWYLDAVCPGWDALISDDYTSIMPLTGNRKFGFHYLFRPMLCQQLGLFSLSPPRTEELDAFIESIPSKYRLVQFCLNSFNHPSDDFTLFQHDTYELSLQPDYELIRTDYRDNHKRNIKKAYSSGINIVDNLEQDLFFGLLAQDSSPGSKILSGKKNITLLKILMNKMNKHGASKVIGVNSREGKPIAAVLFGHSHNRWIYLVPVNSKEGKESRALFAIVDHLIRSRSGSNEILDFEGSDIPGLAQFYNGFGAQKKHYTEIRRNTLPWPIKSLK